MPEKELENQYQPAPVLELPAYGGRGAATAERELGEAPDTKRVEQEARQARELRSEKAAAERMEKLKDKVGESRVGQAMVKGKAIAGRMARSAAAGSDWPYILAIVVSVVDDMIDFADVSIGLGIDQLLDFIMLCLIVSTRLFIKNQPGWWQLRIAVFICELIPGVGILPLWSMTAIYSWQKAKRMRAAGAYQSAVAEGEAENEAGESAGGETAEPEAVVAQRKEAALERKYARRAA